MRNAGVTERSALTTTNYVPFGRRFTLFQAAEFDISRPGGQADRGLTYLFASARAVLSERFNLQGSYQRGRSIDARGIAEAVNTGRAVTQQTLTGLLYESAGGRATVNLPKRSVGAGTIFGGYYHDRLDETSGVSHRTVVGGQVIDLAESGLDVMVTDSRVNRTSGTYHSRYVSVGAQVTDRIYVMGDYSSSLAIIRFGRGSGLLIETRPRTVRWSGSVTGSLTRVMGLLLAAIAVEIIAPPTRRIGTSASCPV